MKTKTNYYSSSLIGIPPQQFAETEKSILARMDALISKLDSKTFFTSRNSTPDSTLIDNISDMIQAYYLLPRIRDPIRAVTGNYLFLNNNVLEKVVKNSLLFEMFKITFTPLVSDVDNINIDKIPVHIHKDVRIEFVTPAFEKLVNKHFSRTSQEILKDEEIKNQIINLFITKFAQLLSNSTKNDYTKFSINNLVNQTENRDYNNIVSLNENYNFFIQKYENLFNNNYENITMIPNYYCLNQYVSQEEPTAPLQELVSLKERVKITRETIGSEEYYVNYSDNLDTTITNELTNVLSSYIIDAELVSNPTVYLSTEAMPYVNEFSFNDDNTNILSEFITDNSLNYLASINIHNNLNISQKFINLNTINVELTGSPTTENKNYTVIDYINVFDFNAGFTLNKDEKTFYFSNSDSLTSLTKSSSIFTFLKLHNLIIKLMSETNYASILNCNDLSNYCLSYTVDKFVNTAKKQTVSLTRDNNSPLYNFIDSQVVYDNDYEYSFNTNNLINNVEYSFENVRINKDKSINVNIHLSYKPKVIKCEFGKFNTKMLDKPPIPVDIKFYPFYGVNNKIKIILNSQTGKLLEKPILLSEQDSAFFDKHKPDQYGKIVFESDDNVKAVQVFRTTTEPSSYSDFSNISNYFVDFINTTCVAYDDFITPNVKYYYLFRTLDVHNQISNPSSIYEVQLIDNDGAVYPLIKEYIFNNRQDFNTSKSFKKYLQISPAYSQKLFDFENGNVMFSEQNQLWGQKFKIRIKSKKSGKVLDLNVLFDKKEIKIN